MEIQTQLEIHRTIEYIKQDAEFPFDTHDDPEDILEYYEVDLDLGEDERQLLIREIRKIAAAAQSREMAQLALNEGR